MYMQFVTIPERVKSFCRIDRKTAYSLNLHYFWVTANRKSLRNSVSLHPLILSQYKIPGPFMPTYCIIQLVFLVLNCLQARIRSL